MAPEQKLKEQLAHQESKAAQYCQERNQLKEQLNQEEANKECLKLRRELNEECQHSKELQSDMKRGDGAREF